MNHIVIGASIPYLISLAVYLGRGCRASIAFLLGVPVFLAMGSLWAIVPDMPRLFGRMDLYREWAFDPRMNVFFFHHAIDSIEGYSPVWLVLFVLMVGSLLAAAWRELRRIEKHEQRRRHREPVLQ
mgnify:CR=1 FL=1